LSHSILEPLDSFFVDFDKSLCGDLFGVLVLEFPDAIFLRKFFLCAPDFRENTNLESTHVKQKVGIVLRVYTHEGVVPLNSGESPRKSIFDFPKRSSSQVDIVLHQPHPAISWPAFLIIIADNVFIVGVRVLGQKSLDQVSRLVLIKSKDHVDLVDISTIQADGVSCLGIEIVEGHELIWIVDGARELGCSLQSENE
jgi:hypothetical protein